MIVVTGGAGFIGSNIVAGLEASGAGPICVVDHLGTGDKWKNLRGRELEELIDPAGLDAFLQERGREITYVIHMGAISATTETDADLIVDNNLRLSQRIWRWCAGHDVPLIYASSAATYGDGARGFDDDGTPEALAKLDKDKFYLVYCAGGVRSARACKKMTGMGFKYLVDLAPGFKGWKAAGKAIEKP